MNDEPAREHETALSALRRLCPSIYARLPELVSGFKPIEQPDEPVAETKPYRPSCVGDAEYDRVLAAVKNHQPR
jgi:hypothetical protein